MDTKTTAAFEKAYTQLNTEQKQAVDTVEGPVMVLAGPGTGKTQTLTVRIGNILQKTQLDPWNILCLTFTESAAAEMRERLAGLIGASAYHVQISTFHSFCNGVLQDHPEIFALASDWQPLSDVERVRIIQETIDTLPGTSPLKPFGAPYLYLKDVVQHIQALKQEDISPENFIHILDAIQAFVFDVGESITAFASIKASERTDDDCVQAVELIQTAIEKHHLPQVISQQIDEIEDQFTQMREMAEGKREAGKARTQCKNGLKRLVGSMETNVPRWIELAGVYKSYQQRLKDDGRYDFEDMIIRVVEEFKNNKELLADYQEQFQYILVDEFQDTNGAQNEVVELLGSYDEQPNIFVVGDDKQSIYRFQGASLANMLAFYERYKKDIQVVSLADNYRSQKDILTASAALISHSKHSLTHEIPGVSADLVPQTHIPAQSIRQYIAESPDHEVAVLAREILALLKNGVAPGEIAVLVRYNRDAIEIANMLRRFDVVTSLAAGENALEQMPVQQWITIWRYILNSHHLDSTLADVIQYDWWGIAPLDALKAIHGASRDRKALTQFFSDATSLAQVGVADPHAIVAVMSRLASWKALAANTTVANLITTMLEESKWLDDIEQDGNRLAELEHMKTLLQQAKESAASGAHSSLADFVELIALHVRHDVPLITPQRRLGKDAVTVMTAHKSKGQEFEYVFIPRFIDGSWGGGRSPGRLRLPEGLVRGDLVADGEALEDERRLFYVSLTRARRQVVLSRAQVTVSERPAVPSVFLHELADVALETIEEKETEQGVADRLVAHELTTPKETQGDIRAWVSGLLDGYVMSVTHLNTYLKDPDGPKLFFERNLLRLPSVRTTHQAMGTAAHNALNDFFQAAKASDTLPKKEFLLEQFTFHLGREALTEQEYMDVLAVGKDQLGNYFDFYRRDFITNTLGEYDFRTHHVRVGDVFITGKIDKIEMVGERQVNVVDYKTGAPEKGMARLRPGGDYHRQIVFYQLLCELSPQFEYEMVSGEVDFIRPNKKGDFVKKKIEVTDKDKQQLSAEIKRVWQEIQELKFLK